MAVGELSSVVSAFPPRSLRERLITARLIVLTDMLLRSGSSIFRRRVGLGDSEWRVLAQVGAYAPISALRVGAILGHDKAQISRTLKRLIELGLVQRENRRGAITPTEAGFDRYGQIVAASRWRLLQLMQDVTETEAQILPKFIATMLQNSVELLAEELSVVGSADANQKEVVNSVHQALQRLAGPRPDPELIPFLIALRRSVEESANVTYRRDFGLQSFDWKLFSIAAESEEMELTRLIHIVNRDKSQVSRAIKRMVDRGLLGHRMEASPRRAVISTTEAGRRMFEELSVASLARNAAITRGLTPAEDQLLRGILDKLTYQADALWRHEVSLTRGSAKASADAAGSGHDDERDA